MWSSMYRAAFRAAILIISSPFFRTSSVQIAGGVHRGRDQLLFTDSLVWSVLTFIRDNHANIAHLSPLMYAPHRVDEHTGVYDDDSCSATRGGLLCWTWCGRRGPAASPRADERASR